MPVCICIKYLYCHFSIIDTEEGSKDALLIVAYTVIAILFVVCMGLLVLLVLLIWICKDVSKLPFCMLYPC